MKINKWTMALAAAGVVGLNPAAQAEEATETVMTAVSSTTISGYVSTTAIWRPGTGQGTVAGRPVITNGAAGKQDGFNLDVFNLTISKPLDEGEWSAGYKAELLFGQDAGMYDPTAGSGGAGIAAAPAAADSSALAFKNAYVAVRAPIGNGLDIKMGIFDTIIGYEGFNYTDNVNYSRSRAWGLEPYQHTGLLLSYTVTDWLSVAAGVANQGITVGANQKFVGSTTGFESRKAYMGAFTLTAPDSMGFLSGASLTAGAVTQQRDINAGGKDAGDTVNLYVGGALPLPVEGLAVGFAYDYRANAGFAAPLVNGTAPSSDYANATALYVSYQATEKLGTHLRAEYATGTSGTFYGGGGPGDLDSNDAILGLTATVDYKLWENVITRAEVTWDTALTGGGFGDAPFGTLTAPAGGSGNNGEKNMLFFALNVVYQF
jgi:hypothetical protein